MSRLNPYFYAYNPELLAFENAWIGFINKQEINTLVIKPVVFKSWRRCYDLGMNPLSDDKLPIIDGDQIRRRLENNDKLMSVVTPYMDSIFNMIKGSEFRVDFSDSDGYIIRSFCNEGTQYEWDKTTPFLGSNRLESVAGTNSIGLAFIEGKPTQVSGAEHYMRISHQWSCSSAPILQDNGKIIGVLSITGRYELVHFHTLALVASAAKAIENEIYIQEVNEIIEVSNSRLRTTLETITDGVVYLDTDEIMEVNQELCNLIGREAKDIVGKKVHDVIQTIPSLTDMFKGETNSYQEGEIIFKGVEKNYKCLFAYKGIYGINGEETGKVLIFTRVEEIESLAKKIKYQAKFTFDDIVTQSDIMKSVVGLAAKASRHDSRTIIEGESGTGKEMLAQAIHNNSYRKNGPFIAIDCGTLSNELIESELFGYEGGSFTGAKKDGKKGLLELADKGTLFLDEIGNMPLEMQIKFLRVLQEGCLKRVGGTTSIYTDVRVIAATNSDLKEAMVAGKFREDLYYRLNVFNIQIPPLRDRKEDIPLLINSFIYKKRILKGNYKIEKNAAIALQEYDWPGNVRQLANAIERALIMSTGNTIRRADLPLEISKTQDFSNWCEDTVQTLEEKTFEYINYVLKKNNNNVSKTATELDISRSKIYNIVKLNKDENRGLDDDI